jgi:hypothetical protein
MTIAEGGGRRAIMKKFQEVYVPSLKANYMVWPAVQMLNFRVIPLQFQIVSFQVLHSINIQLIICYSHSYPQLVSLGQHTLVSPTLPTNQPPKFDLVLVY